MTDTNPDNAPEHIPGRPLVGISSCLLGEKVRYDGGGKLDRYLRDILGEHVDFKLVCPEVESGMGIPRDAMRLVRVDGEDRLVTRKTGVDQTARMRTWMQKRLKALAAEPLCGYIFKAKSPSCGMFRVKVYNPGGTPATQSRGIYAAEFASRFPSLPVEEEGRLNDSVIRENFIERVFVLHRWHALNRQRRTASRIMDFHARHKYILMAHSPATLKELGAFLANSSNLPVKEVYETWFGRFITALARQSTRHKNTNVLQHIMGYFRKHLDKDEKAELGGIIDNYRRGLLPLVVPVTMLNHYVRKYREPYLARQYYLNPHPLELMLRNHV